MADVKKIKLPDNSVYNIKDYRIPGVDTVPTSGSGNVITSGGIYAANYAGSDSNGGPALKTYGIPYGAVDSASTATVITATVDNFPTELTDGVCAYIRNDIISSASGWTLNVNGTGAKPVYASNADATRVTTLFSAASTFLFVYNSTRVSGGCWDMYYGYNANDNTIGYNLRTNGTIAPTKSKFYRYRILFTSPDGQYLIPSNTSTSTNATAIRSVNQDKIDPFGPIYYYNSTTAIEANASVGASYLWLQYSAIYLGYSFNRTSTALTLTAKHPIYIKCAPQTDGSAIIDDGTPFVQALPSTEDGKIYIFLGYAESATTATLYYYHPIYYYKDNAIRLWTNAADTTITVDTELDLESENPISNGAVTQVIFDNEQVTAAALNDLRDDISTIDKVTASSLNDLNDRMLEAEDTLSEMDEYISDLGEVTSAALNNLNGRMLNAENALSGTSDLEEVVSAALNDLNDRTLDLEDAIQNVDSEEMTSVTWEGLITLKNNNELKPGHQYRITDYQTTTILPGTRSAGHQFDIIVTALNTNTLSEDAKAIAHEGLPFMGYETFDTSDSICSVGARRPCFEAWELKYSITNSLNFEWSQSGKFIHADITNESTTYIFEYSSNRSESEFSSHPHEWRVTNIDWPTYDYVYTTSESPLEGDKVYSYDGNNSFSEVGTASKVINNDYRGTIYYMKDEFNNVAPFDFKNIQFLKKFSIVQGDYSDTIEPDDEGAQSYWLYAYTLGIETTAGNTTFNMYDATMVCEEGVAYTGTSTSNNFIGYERGTRMTSMDGVFEIQALRQCCILFIPGDCSYYSGISNVFIDTNGYIPDTQQVIMNSDEFRSYRFMKYQDITYPNIVGKDATNSQLVSGSAVYNTIYPTPQNINRSILYPVVEPNKLNRLGLPSETISGNKSISFQGPADSTKANHYYLVFNTGSTVPTVTWPSGLIWPEGNPPTLKPNHHYEFSVLDNVVAWMEV